MRPGNSPGDVHPLSYVRCYLRLLGKQDEDRMHRVSPGRLSGQARQRSTGQEKDTPFPPPAGRVPISVTLKLNQSHTLRGALGIPNLQITGSQRAGQFSPYCHVSVILTLARVLNKAKVRAQWIMNDYLISFWWLKNDMLLLESFPLFLCFLQALGKTCCIILPFVQTKKYNRTMNATPCVMRFPMLTGGVVASNLFRWSLPQAWVFQSMHVPISI